MVAETLARPYAGRLREPRLDEIRGDFPCSWDSEGLERRVRATALFCPMDGNPRGIPSMALPGQQGSSRPCAARHCLTGTGAGPGAPVFVIARAV